LSAPFKRIGNLRCSGRCSVGEKGIIQSPITSCRTARRRDHSVWQASASSILCAGDAAHRPWRGWWDRTARAKSDIYDCLVFYSVLLTDDIDEFAVCITLLWWVSCIKLHIELPIPPHHRPL